MSTTIGKCRTCGRDNTLPSKEGIAESLADLERATSPDPDPKDRFAIFGAAGGAAALLRMVAGSMDGLCIFCQPPPEWLTKAAAVSP
jgi:hypothetical protein